MTIDFLPFWISFKLATLTTVLLILIAFPLALLFDRKEFQGKVVLESLLTLPVVLPPTVLGFYLLLLFSPNFAVGNFLLEKLGLRFLFHFSGLVIASLIFAFPFMFQPLRNGLSALDETLIEASYTLGKSKWATFFHVMLPNLKTELLSGVINSFTRTLSSFGVLLMVGGNISGKTRVASIAIYEEVEHLNFQTAHIYSLILVGFSFVVLLVLTKMTQKQKKRGIS